MRKLIAILVKKPISVSILILLQLGMIYLFVYFMSVQLSETFFILQVLNLILVIYIINRYDNPSYKLAWIVFVLVVPLVGGVTYLMFGGRKVPKDLRIGIKQLSPHEPLLVQNPTLLKNINNPHIRRQIHYLYEYNGMPVFNQSQVTYHKSGEAKFEAMMGALKNAQKTIFLEYFIIKPGFVWDTIFDVLRDKAQAGLDVRLIFDDAGCASMGLDFLDNLKAAGIQAYAFNPLRPTLVITMNNRDHRKIAIIDGQIGFLGGVNLADEYINLTHPFGYWKDVAIEIRGQAVYGLTLMFLQFYDYLAHTSSDYHAHKPSVKNYPSSGYVQLYSDSPTDEEPVGQTMHLNLISCAEESITILTPYLVVGYEITMALIAAAKSGIRVRIILPHIPDKRYVFSVTQSNYEQLILSGIEIYEYLPGFMHAKVILVDDYIATVGTANLDFRSYFLHFECGALLFESDSIIDISADIQDILEQCVQITLEDAQTIPLVVKFWRAILNVFSPLL